MGRKRRKFTDNFQGRRCVEAIAGKIATIPGDCGEATMWLPTQGEVPGEASLV